MDAQKPKDGGRLNVRLPRELLRRFKIECAKREITNQDAAAEAIQLWLRTPSTR